MRRATSKLLEVHLMIVHPDNYLNEFANAGADLLIVHQETTMHLDSSINQIKRLGKKVGVAVNPATPVSVLEHVLEEVDLVLVMTVNPGFGGQDLIGYTLRKVRAVRDALDMRNPRCDVEVDGGVELHTIRPAYEAGANVFVAGTSVFDYAGGPRAGVESLLRAAKGE
jgi:ribulose-phosphate 3-epimerase